MTCSSCGNQQPTFYTDKSKSTKQHTHRTLTEQTLSPLTSRLTLLWTCLLTSQCPPQWAQTFPKRYLLTVGKVFVRLLMMGLQIIPMTRPININLKNLTMMMINFFSTPSASNLTTSISAPKVYRRESAVLVISTKR